MERLSALRLAILSATQTAAARATVLRSLPAREWASALSSMGPDERTRAITALSPEERRALSDDQIDALVGLLSTASAAVKPLQRLQKRALQTIQRPARLLAEPEP